MENMTDQDYLDLFDIETDAILAISASLYWNRLASDDWYRQITRDVDNVRRNPPW